MTTTTRTLKLSLAALAGAFAILTLQAPAQAMPVGKPELASGFEQVTHKRKPLRPTQVIKNANGGSNNGNGGGNGSTINANGANASGGGFNFSGGSGNGNGGTNR